MQNIDYIQYIAHPYVYLVHTCILENPYNTMNSYLKFPTEIETSNFDVVGFMFENFITLYLF